MPKLTIRNNSTKLSFKVELIEMSLVELLKPEDAIVLNLDALYVKCKIYYENGDVYFERSHLDTDTSVVLSTSKAYVYFEVSRVERPFTEYMYIQVADVLKKDPKFSKLSYQDTLTALRTLEIEQILRYEQLRGIIMDLKGLTLEDLVDKKSIEEEFNDLSDFFIGCLKFFVKGI